MADFCDVPDDSQRGDAQPWEYSAAQVGRLFGVDEGSVTRWCRRPDRVAALGAERRGGRWRFDGETIRQLLRDSVDPREGTG